MNTIQPGRYRHYKGKDYVVLDVARHSETEEELVVYRQDYGDRGLWVRPKTMFMETVEVEGRQVPRFQLIEPVGQSGKLQNLFADVPAQLPQELVQILHASANARIERIVSHGQASPEGFWYDQDQSEWVAVLKGAARLRFDGDDKVARDDSLATSSNIPAHRKHRVEWDDAQTSRQFGWPFIMGRRNGSPTE